jgi:hypothetical protein
MCDELSYSSYAYMDSLLYEIAFLWMDVRYGGWDFGVVFLLNIELKKNAMSFYDIAFTFSKI